MGEIRSPYFSLGQNHFGDNSDHIHSPYISYGGEDYHGDYAAIHPPYSSAGDYRGDNAEIHSPYSSAGDYLADNTEIHSEALFHQDISGNSYSDVRIYRVGKALRKSKKAMYIPQQISIGPIHHGKKNLRLMERKKSEYNKIFWEKRVSKAGELHGAKDKFWNALKKDEKKISQCYEDGSHIENPEGFLGLILRDAVFIFELFLKYSENEEFKKDSILKEPGLRAAIRRDLILLENQLPFFILENLYKCLPENIKGGNTEFKTLACFYFQRHFPSKFSSAATTPILHFTDLVRSLLSFARGNGKPVEQIKSFHSATRLRQAGVKFKVPREHDCLLDVDFRRLRKEFHIPQLQIHGDTESLFRNLMALEKSVYPGQEYICHYINLLSILVVKPKDAKLLMKNKIVTYNKDEVAVRDLIYSLASSSTTDFHSCYHDIFSAVDDYYKSSWAKNPAYFIEEFFGNFWKAVGTVSAASLLILTLVQTICSIRGLR